MPDPGVEMNPKFLFENPKGSTHIKAINPFTNSFLRPSSKMFMFR